MSSLSPLSGGNFIHQDKDRTIDGGSILKRFSLEKKTAIITGAGAGIGYAVAEAYAEMGCNLALWYNSNDKAIEKAENLGKKYSVKCKAYKVNVRSAQDVEKAVDEAV